MAPGVGFNYQEGWWFQKDGATVHTTIAVQHHFGDQVIRRFTAWPWPANSPDLSVLGYWFWSVCLSELRKVFPNWRS